jgi:hypothetical protein
VRYAEGVHQVHSRNHPASQRTDRRLLQRKRTKLRTEEITTHRPNHRNKDLGRIRLHYLHTKVKAAQTHTANNRSKNRPQTKKLLPMRTTRLQQHFNPDRTQQSLQTAGTEHQSAANQQVYPPRSLQQAYHLYHPTYPFHNHFLATQLLQSFHRLQDQVPYQVDRTPLLLQYPTRRIFPVRIRGLRSSERYRAKIRRWGCNNMNRGIITEVEVKDREHR